MGLFLWVGLDFPSCMNIPLKVPSSSKIFAKLWVASTTCSSPTAVWECSSICKAGRISRGWDLYCWRQILECGNSFLLFQSESDSKVGNALPRGVGGRKWGEKLVMQDARVCCMPTPCEHLLSHALGPPRHIGVLSSLDRSWAVVYQSSCPLVTGVNSYVHTQDTFRPRRNSSCNNERMELIQWFSARMDMSTTCPIP